MGAGILGGDPVRVRRSSGPRGGNAGAARGGQRCRWSLHDWGLELRGGEVQGLWLYLFRLGLHGGVGGRATILGGRPGPAWFAGVGTSGDGRGAGRPRPRRRKGREGVRWGPMGEGGLSSSTPLPLLLLPLQTLSLAPAQSAAAKHNGPSPPPRPGSDACLRPARPPRLRRLRRAGVPPSALRSPRLNPAPEGSGGVGRRAQAHRSGVHGASGPLPPLSPPPGASPDVPRRSTTTRRHKEVCFPLGASPARGPDGGAPQNCSRYPFSPSGLGRTKAIHRNPTSLIP